MRITKIVVQTHNPGTDMVFVHTDLPSPMPGVTDHPMGALFHAEADKGVEYALEHFPDVPIETVDANTGEKRRVRSYPTEGPGCWYGEPIKEKD